MTFRQSTTWCSATDSIYDLDEPDQQQGQLPAWREAWRLFRRRKRYDLVCTMGAKESLVYGLLCAVALVPSKQIMCEVFIDDPQPLHPLWRIKTALYRLVARRSIGILTNSSGEIETISSRFKVSSRGGPASGGHGSRLRYVPMHTNIAEPHAVDENDGYVLSAGYTRRDYAALLQAAPKIRSPVTILCGEKDLRTVELPSNVTIVRNVPRETYLDYLRHCAVLVLPLLETERSTGQVVMLEAMALGKPVVATRAPGVIDHLRDGETGVLVERGSPTALADAVNSLHDAPDKAQRLAEAALEDVLEKHTIEKHARAKLDAIRELWETATAN